MKKSRRLLALVLCVLMCVSMFPAQVFAEETNSADFGDSEEVIETETAPTEPETPAEEPSDEAGDSSALPDQPADPAEQPAENEAVTEAEIEEETVSNDAAMAPANSCGDGLTWELNDEGTLTITGTGEMWDWSDNTETPWYSVFASIKSVVIENGVKSIGNYAFSNCWDALESVKIGNDVESIGKAAFQYCYKLNNLTIGSSVRTIGGDAFEGCKKLTEITVPASVESIGIGAFSCSALTAINVNADNAYYSSSDGVLFDKTQKTLVTFPRGRSDSYTIPDTVTVIGDNAFYCCSNLTGITIPDSVTTIGEYAFEACYGLTGMTIPAGVTKIGNYAFSSCPNLYNVIFLAGAAMGSESNIFYGDTLTAYYLSDSTGWTDEIKDACGGNVTWESMSQLKPIDGSNLCWCLEDGTLTIVGTGKMPNWSLFGTPWDSVRTTIGNIRIGEGVTSVGNYAFCGCTDVNSVSLPSTLNTIGFRAFMSCSGLSAISLPASLTGIGNYAFMGCKNLACVTIPEGVTSVGDDAFYGCTSMTTVSLPSTLATISDDMFYGCEKLTNVSISEGVNAIGNNAFRGCEALEALYIPSTMTSIGSSAFHNCTKLSWIMFVGPSELTTIGSYAFFSCEALDDIYLPATVESIGNSAFAFTGLTKVFFIGNAPEFGTDVFGSDTLTAYYNVGCDWTADDMQNYGGTVTWTPWLLTPQSITDKNVDGGVQLTWDAVTGADHYEIWRRQRNEDTTWTSFTKIGETTECTYLDGNVVFGTDYIYHIVARDSQTGATSEIVRTEDAYITALEIPKFSVQNETDGITISWQAVTGARYYYVYRKNDDGIFEAIGTASGTTYTFKDTDVTYGQAYTYTIAAVGNYDDARDEIGKTILRLAAPVLTDIRNTDSGVKLTWTAVNGADSYEVYRSTDGGTTWFKIGNTSDCIYTDTGASSGTEYQYAVRAYNKDTQTESNYSNAMSIVRLTTPVLKDSYISNVASGVQIKWEAVTGADYYRVYRYNNSYDSWDMIGESESLYYTDTEVDYGTVYRYTVTAIGYGTEISSQSAYDHDGLSILRLAAPELTGISNTDTGVKLTWTAVDDADSYGVFRQTKSGSGWGPWVCAGKEIEGCTFTDTGNVVELVSGTEYNYEVRAYDSDTESWGVGSNSLSITYEPTVMLEGIFNKTEGIKITWKEFPGATSYEVLRQVWNASKGTWSDGWSSYGTADSCTYTDSQVDAGKEYRYTVKVKGGTYFDTTGLSIIRLTTPTAYVNNVAEGIKITWEAVTGADRYNVYRMDEKGWILFAYVTGNTNTTFTDTSVNYGTVYQYTVAAGVADMTGTAAVYESALDETGLSILRLAAPELTDIRNMDTGVKLTWTAVDGADGYNIYRKDTTPGTINAWQKVGSTENCTFIDDNEITSGHTYEYIVKAYTDSGDETPYLSAESNSLSITYTPTPVLESISNTVDGVTITWKPFPNATNYRILRKTIDPSTGTWVTNWVYVNITSKCTYTDKDVKAGQIYRYTIQDVNTLAKDETGLSITYYAPGDVNADGAVNLKDLLMLKEALANGTADRMKYSSGVDVNNDGAVNLKDLLILKRTLAGVTE